MRMSFLPHMKPPKILDIEAPILHSGVDGRLRLDEKTEVVTKRSCLQRALPYVLSRWMTLPQMSIKQLCQAQLDVLSSRAAHLHSTRRFKFLSLLNRSLDLPDHLAHWHLHQSRPPYWPLLPLASSKRRSTTRACDAMSIRIQACAPDLSWCICSPDRSCSP